jgi:beta-lactamase regulating signal transducer with metallopeptidase domain
MKQLTKAFSYKALVTFLMITIMQAMAFAQDSTGSSKSSSSSSTTTTTTQETWYSQPWVWIVGGAVLLLLIVALMRGNSNSSDTRSDKVTVTKSVRTDTDV